MGEIGRQHSSPNLETGKTIVVVEDASLPANHCRLELAHSEMGFARAVQQMEFGRGPLVIEAVPVKGQSRKELRFVVSSDDYDDVVAMVEDDSIEPFTDLEFAREIMRATRGNN
jgi:hypothetical protein